MNIKNEVENNILKVTFELTEKEIEILNFVRKNGYIEFRISYIEEDKTDSSGKFKESELSSLISYEFLEYDTDAWHSQFNLGRNGKVYLGLLENNN